MSATLRWLVMGILLASMLVQAAEPVRLVSGDGYIPYADSALPEGGIATSIVRHSLQLAGYAPSIDWLPWSRGYVETLAGHYAATFPYVKTPDRQSLYLFSNPIIQIKTYLYARAGAPELSLNPPTLRGKILCLPLGFVVSQSVMQMLGPSAAHLVQPADMSACASMVSLGRADFFVTNNLLGSLLARKLPDGYPAIAASAQPLQTNTLHFIAPRNQPAASTLIKRFNEGLAQLQASKVYDQLIEQYQQTLFSQHSKTASQ